VVVREAGLSDASGQLKLPAARHRLRPVVLRPDQATDLQVTVAIDPVTPRGEYPAELDIAGQRLPAVLRVVEAVQLQVAPQTVVINNQPERPQAKQLVVTNQGNVAVSLGREATVNLHVDEPRFDAWQEVIERLLEADRAELEERVAALLVIAREPPPVHGSVRARTTEPVDVGPGQTRALEMEFSLETELPGGRRFRGTLPVLTEDVEIVVVTDGEVTGHIE
jgi:hypothetical protein